MSACLAQNRWFKTYFHTEVILKCIRMVWYINNIHMPVFISPALLLLYSFLLEQGRSCSHLGLALGTQLPRNVLCYFWMQQLVARSEKQSLQAALPYIHAAVARLAGSLAESFFCHNSAWHFLQHLQRILVFFPFSACVGWPCDCLANIFLISWQCAAWKTW